MRGRVAKKNNFGNIVHFLRQTKNGYISKGRIKRRENLERMTKRSKSSERAQTKKGGRIKKGAKKSECLKDRMPKIWNEKRSE